MATISELKAIKEREGKLLAMENEKLKKARKLDKERQEVVDDIRKIRAARMKGKKERVEKSNKEIAKIKSGAKKAGKKVLNYLYNLRGY